MGLFDNIFKKPKKEDVKKGETPQTSQVSTNTTSSISSANGYEELSSIVNESSERTAEVLAGRDAQEKVSDIYSDYAETVIIADLDRVFGNLKARAKYLNEIGADALGDINSEIQFYNDLMQKITQLRDQERFAPMLGVSPDTRDDSVSGLSGRLAETEKHLDVLKSRYRAEPTTDREDILKRMAEEFKAIDDELKGKSIGRKTSKRNQNPTTLEDNALSTGFSDLAKNAEKRVATDMGITQKNTLGKTQEEISLDDLLNGPMF